MPGSQAASDFLVVGIGASAGGLDACRSLLESMPPDNGMAFILVQHLDPSHESLMVQLLKPHTAMQVCDASNGTPLEPDRVYVMPPGMYLAVVDGAFRLSQPPARRGPRLPFDFLLESMAKAYGPRAACIVLSGTGADGSAGLRSVRAAGGFVLAQTPEEAGYDGMPRSAIATGEVDAVLGVAKISGALLAHARQAQTQSPETRLQATPTNRADEVTSAIIELLRAGTRHDFRSYKKGTLERRIERRMALASIDADAYLKKLETDKAELELLATDLLIHVTCFFRDTAVFDLLASQTIPALVRDHAADQPLRVWVAGCSSGEEAYSLSILFREAIAASGRKLKLQVFASDVHADAIAMAREGRYPSSIESDISEDRLARFFSRDELGYRVLPELRASAVFTVQDVLSDAPFSRLDFISCRNLLIYLGAEAQSRVMAMFHFALRQGGILLLGSAESPGTLENRFELDSKAARLYRRIGHNRPGELNFLKGSSDGLPVVMKQELSQGAVRQKAIAELCQRLVMESFAPAAVLVNARHECIYSIGVVDRYLKVAPGHSTHDLPTMLPQELRARLRSMMRQDTQHVRAVIDGGYRTELGRKIAFSVDVQSVTNDGEDFFLVCFIDQHEAAAKPGAPISALDLPRITQLEHELDTTRKELQAAVKELEVSGEEQKAVNEEALSVNEESQAANEELLTSKEELQSLNEELTALNSQLHETLARQRTMSNDLQNVLYSTDVATLFLDSELNIRFFTPATRSLFNIIPGDVGRPLADLNSLATDNELPEDARTVLRTFAPLEREVKARNGTYFVRRILPYRTHDNGVEGVVITFTDIPERKHIAQALEEAKRESELATAAKSRFLACASHDLRQPLQTLKLLQGSLLDMVHDAPSLKLTTRIGNTIGAMAGMLNALLDINQIETGAVEAHMVDFKIGDLLDRVREEFSYHAASEGLVLRVVPCRLWIHSDPRLLEQMIRNLLANAFKYTRAGRVLLGCRRDNDRLSIEVWDSGPGIPEDQLKAIFEEYHQLDNPARELSRGVGLGLAIVQRLGGLLKHEVSVRSWLGSGSVFAIEVGLSAAGSADDNAMEALAVDLPSPAHHSGVILVVEDHPELADLLGTLLRAQGYQATIAADGVEAVERVMHGGLRPDLILADYNLPKDLTGLQLVTKLRESLQRGIPAIILTGDISTRTSREVALHHCALLNKPAKFDAVLRTIERLLPTVPTPRVEHAPALADSSKAIEATPVIFVVDDDGMLRDTIRTMLEAENYPVEDFANSEAFLAAYVPGRDACLLLDASLPGMNGIQLLQHLHEAGDHLPTIMITGCSDVSMAVDAMKAGASDFIEKPFGRTELLDSISRTLEHSHDANKLQVWHQHAAERIAELTPRQREVMDRVLAGQPSKIIAAELDISQRTVENHRASIMKRTDSKSIPALARLAQAAERQGSERVATPE